MRNFFTVTELLQQQHCLGEHTASNKCTYTHLVKRSDSSRGPIQIRFMADDTNSQHSKFCGSAQTLMRDEQKLLFSLRAINHLRMFKIYNEQESNDSIRHSTLMYIAFQKGTRSVAKDNLC